MWVPKVPESLLGWGKAGSHVAPWSGGEPRAEPWGAGHSAVPGSLWQQKVSAFFELGDVGRAGLSESPREVFLHNCI